MTVCSNLLLNSEIFLKMAASYFFKVPKDSVMVCLRCPLCDNLVREATTISECLHTFCRVCIYQHLDDDEEENDCCPVCNVNLGCSPLEKLRADRQLDDVIGKLFPGKLKKRKFIDDSVDDATLPSKRKERSLSSLGVGCVPSSNEGLTDPNANSMSETSDTETDNESEEKKSNVVKSEVVSRNERDDAPGPANLETIDMKDNLENINEDSEVKIVRKLEQLASSRKVAEQPRGRDLAKPARGYARSSSHDKQNKGSGNANTQTKENGATPRTRKPRRSLEVRDFPIAFAVVRERSNKNMKRRSALAQLAEIAIGQAVNRTDHVKPYTAKTTEERVISNNGKHFTEAEQSNQQLREKISKSPSPAHNSIQSLSWSNQRHHLKNTQKQEKQDAGFWFVLQAENALSGTSSLPQISSRYIRMKDGKMPVSIIKKYLVEKLCLNNENEVEITCRGQSVVANLPLENVQAIWITNMDLHSTRERNRPEDYMMVLNYRRKLTHM